jgi:hypothetical protein
MEWHAHAIVFRRAIRPFPPSRLAAAVIGLAGVGSAPAGPAWAGNPWYGQLEAEIELNQERQADESATELTFDEVGLALGAALWRLELGIKYESDGARLRVEEGSLRVGDSDEMPYFVQFGRTGVAFGQLESNFVEDPSTVVLAEIDASSAVFGVASERLEASVSVLESVVAPNDVDFAFDALLPCGDAVAFGTGWTSDLAEAVELRELREDRRESPPRRDHSVQAMACFVGLRSERWLGHLEWVGALRAFAPRTLRERWLRPQAMDCELGHRFGDNFVAAARLEWSRELPESPNWQAGLALWSGHFEPARLGIDFLQAEGRQLIGVIVAFEFGDAGDE